jgi:hypothetical protein
MVGRKGNVYFSYSKGEKNSIFEGKIVKGFENGPNYLFGRYRYLAFYIK